MTVDYLSLVPGTLLKLVLCFVSSMKLFFGVVKMFGFITLNILGAFSTLFLNIQNSSVS